MKPEISDEQIIEHLKEGHGAKWLKNRYAVGDYRIKRLKAELVRRGWSPEHDMNHVLPDGFKLARHAQYYDKDGKAAGKWVIGTPDNERMHEIMRVTLEAMAASISRLPPLPAPAATDSDLCNLYTLSDCHVGMLAWHKEGGQDWDLKIAEKTVIGAFEQMISSSPKASTAVISQLGDFQHFDGLEAVTPAHKHLLDADGRFGKVVEIAIRMLRRIVDIALQHHDTVHLIMAEGNHDPASSVWLRKMFSALYEQEPRLTVNDSELPYYVHQHGKTMLAFHHGHLKKNNDLPLLFAAQYPTIWGATTKRYAHTGHRHHTEEKEHSGMTVVQHPTLAARDAYASRGGWIADRQATCITYHREHGKVGSTVVTPEMIKGAA